MQMHSNTSQLRNDFRPRMIVWRLTGNGALDNLHDKLLNQHECLCIIDSIARLSKPIIVLNGDSLMDRPDLHEIIEYGNALDLKMIAEVHPEEITEKLLDRFKPLGPKTFRLILNNHIVEDFETRFQLTPAFQSLERAVDLLRSKEFEIHFSILVTKPNRRNLAFNLDYAFRKNGHGLYCHLRFDRSVQEVTMHDDEIKSLDEFITKISDLKFILPNNMYLSPQCVRYSPFPVEEQNDFDFSDSRHPRWIHHCLAGKTYAFINELGKVFVCSGMCQECGDLREENYNFKSIWMNSEVMQLLREHFRSCVQTRLLLKKTRGIPVQQLDIIQ